MIEPNQIIKSKRKTISISIMKDGTVKLHAPIKMSEEKIKLFLLEKQKWLESKLKLINSNLFEYQDVLQYDALLIYGDRYKPAYYDGNKILIDDENRILIPNKYSSVDKVYSKIKLWFKQLAKTNLDKRLEYLSKTLRLTPSKLKISDTKGRWGACNSKNEISLNFRVVMLPPRLIDYVIIHELSHLIEMNHSPRFWSLVGGYLPTYKQARNEMKIYNFILDLFV